MMNSSISLNNYHWIRWKTNGCQCHWIGLRKMLQESPMFDGKNHGFLQIFNGQRKTNGQKTWKSPINHHEITIFPLEFSFQLRFPEAAQRPAANTSWARARTRRCGRRGTGRLCTWRPCRDRSRPWRLWKSYGSWVEMEMDGWFVKVYLIYNLIMGKTNMDLILVEIRDGFKAWMFPVGVNNHMAVGSLTSSRRRPSRSLPPIAQQRLRRWVMVMVPFLSLKCL